MDDAVLAKILEAQYFITSQLQNLSDNLFTQFGWNQGRDEWEYDVYHLAAYVGTGRFVLSFTFGELTEDHGSPEWERMLSDKSSWFIDKVKTKLPAGVDNPEQERLVRPVRRLSALYILQNADFNYVSNTRKWAVCGWQQIVYVVVSARLTAEETKRCMEALWGAFLALKRRFIKIYAVLDLNRMEINSEEFRHYLKENWVHLLDRTDLAIVFVERSALKKAIWSSLLHLVGRPARVKLFTTSDVAFAWVQRQIMVNGHVANHR